MITCLIEQRAVQAAYFPTFTNSRIQRRNIFDSHPLPLAPWPSCIHSTAEVSVAAVSVAGVSMAEVSVAGMSIAGLSMAGVSVARLSVAGVSVARVD